MQPTRPEPAKIDLSKAGQGNLKRTRGKLWDAAWLLVEVFLVTNPLQVSSRVRAWALRAFGASIGRDVILRPRLRVKCPWNLEIGDRCWVGEGVWIHNQALVTIGADTVISQETFITTGSHAYLTNMDLVVEPIEIGAGVWITSRCIILKGLRIGSNAVVTPGSVVRVDVAACAVVGGNPARLLRSRFEAPSSTQDMSDRAGPDA